MHELMLNIVLNANECTGTIAMVSVGAELINVCRICHKVYGDVRYIYNI